MFGPWGWISREMAKVYRQIPKKPLSIQYDISRWPSKGHLGSCNPSLIAVMRLDITVNVQYSHYCSLSKLFNLLRSILVS